MSEQPTSEFKKAFWEELAGHSHFKVTKSSALRVLVNVIVFIVAVNWLQKYFYPENYPLWFFLSVIGAFYCLDKVWFLSKCIGFVIWSIIIIAFKK
jgi:hypothetical protein